MRFLWKSQLKKERGKFLLQTDEKKKVTRKERLQSGSRNFLLFGVISLWLLFLGTIVYLVIFSSYLKFSERDISGLSLVDEQGFLQEVEGRLSHKYFGFIPRDTFFLIRPAALERSLVERYPLIREVTVRRIFPNTLEISVVERNTIVLWCVMETCVHVLEDGNTTPLTDAYQEEQNRTRTITLKDESNQMIRPGSRAFEDGFVSLAVSLKERLKERFGFETEDTIFLASRYANELRIRTLAGWEIYFNTKIQPEDSLNTLELLLENEISKERLGMLRYIDLRTENRVFYRYQEGAEGVPVQEIPLPEEKKGKSKKKD